MEIKIVKISDLEKIWERVFDIAENASPFVSYGWFFSLGKYLLKKDVEVMLFYEDGKAVGIFPAEIKKHSLSLIGDERVTDLNDIILDPNYSEKIIEFLADYIIKEDLSIDLYPLAEESVLVKLLPRIINEKKAEKTAPFPVLRLPFSWDGYLNSLSSKKRHELRRKLAKVEGATVKQIKASDIDKLFELMEYSSREKKDFLIEEMKEFFRSFALYLESIGALRLRAAFYKKKIIGILFCFQMKDTVYAFNTGYNPDFSELSPGFISFVLDIRSAISEGLSYYNFLRGEERFKFDLGAQRIYTWRIKK